MSAADERLAELLDRWLASVELHARYLDLDDAAYARVQDWPKHQRPSRWVIDLARTRLGELRQLLDERSARGDAGFAEGLELMAFLTTLLGSEHVERFVPLAQPQAGRVEGRSASAQRNAPAERPAPGSVPSAGTAPPSAARGAAPRPRAAPQPTTRPTAASRSSPPPSQPPAPARELQALSAELERATATVVADAVRLLNWGREWPQLAGLIARLADRPGEQDIWKILRRHRATIEAQARRRVD